MNISVEIEGIRLQNVHSDAVCVGRACVIHNPTNHPMSHWQLHWRSDRGIFERICTAHGVGHPDPDQFDYWRQENRMYEAVHGCCGCCPNPVKEIK